VEDKLQSSNRKERNELIGQLLQEKNKGANTQEPKEKKPL
jgi:hypothetical protein